MEHRLTEYQIAQTVQSMLVSAETIRVKYIVDAKQICLAIVTDFTSQLRGWCEWISGERGQQEILNSEN